MLVHFKVENFKNFTTPLSFDLSDVKCFEFNSDSIRDGVVKNALIYGPNASGKTNLGLAVFDLVSHLTDNHVPNHFYDNYLNGANTGTTAAIFRYQFRMGSMDVVYAYEKKGPIDLVRECLHINGEKVISHDREVSSEAFVELVGAENLNRDLKNTRLSVLKYVKNNTVLGDTPVNQAFLDLMAFVEGMLYFRSFGYSQYIGKQLSVDRASQGILEQGLLKDFEEFLNSVGIPCRLTRISENGNELIAFDYGERKIEFSQAASSGTLSLGLLYFWLQALKNEEVSFVFIDEFDAFYHHALARQIVRQINATSCQSILTTHNTGNMSNDLLRPDCYFIIDQGRIQPIFRFTDKELRRAHNIEKMYKAGTFGG